MKRMFLCLILPVIYLSACKKAQHDEDEVKSQQAGQPINSLNVAANAAKIRIAALTGDEKGVQQGAENIAEDFRKSIKLADVTRQVDRESARQAAKSVPGVRSVVWLDRENLFAIVEQNAQKSYETIDSICIKLEPLGDTLGVVVNLQSGAARNGDELEILSRNCQLSPGERAFMQKNRKVDALDPEIRRQHKANNQP